MPATFCPKCGYRLRFADDRCVMCNADAPAAPIFRSPLSGPSVIRMRPARIVSVSAGARGSPGAAPQDQQEKAAELARRGRRSGDGDEAGDAGGTRGGMVAYSAPREFSSNGTKAAGLLVIGGAVGLVVIASWFSRPVAYAIGASIIFGNLYLWMRGQDIGGWLLNMRVLRGNGHVAGFAQMWTRNAASVLSVLPLFFGYWTVFWDHGNQTWHDRLLGTFVVNDDQEYNVYPRSSSPVAKYFFWVTAAMIVAVAAYFAYTRFLAA